MAFDYTCLEGVLSERELLDMRSTLVGYLTGAPGRTLSSVSTRDLSTTFGASVPPELMLKAVNYALYKLNPITYSKPSVAKVRMIYEA